MNKRDLRALRALPPQEIARAVSLRAAAEATTPRPIDVPQRMEDAFHEATHAVVNACYGIRPITAYLPIRNKRGKWIEPRAWVTVGQPGITDDYASPNNPMYGVTALERGTSSIAGEFAEAILGTIPPPTLSTLRYEINDVEDAQRCVRGFMEWRASESKGPGTKAYQARLRAMRGDHTPTTPMSREHREVEWLKVLARAAVFHTHRNFALIDSTAAIMILAADETGFINWPRLWDTVDPWLAHQIDLIPRERPDGHPKLLHSWPVKLLQAGRVDYADSGTTARRAAASLSR